MIEAILRRFVPDYTKTGDRVVREGYGTLSGTVGILLNLLLFAGKLTGGLISGAISVTADAFNNLSDAASSMVTLVGFRLAGHEADADHPFGHGRVEYLAGLIVSALILLVGVELGKSSVEKILHPEETTLPAVTAVILVVSILVKLWMGWFNSGLARRIQSEALRAVAADSRSDAIATAAVLLGLILSRLLSLPLDGWIGVLVAILILKAGIGSAKATLDPLLGQPPLPEEVQAIEEFVLRHPPIQGVHDMVIHDYGPGRRMMSLHAEVPASCSVTEVHDVIDHVERELCKNFHMETVIHMDPVQTDDPRVEELRRLAAEQACAIDPSITIHDFRVISGPESTNLIFDLVLPYHVKLTEDEVRERMEEKLTAVDQSYHAVISVDRSYVR